LRRRCRSWCGCRVRIVVAADAWRLCGVALGGAAEVAIAEILAAKVVDTGKLLQLVEKLLAAAVLTVATLALSAGSLTVVSAILAAVCLRLHAEATVDLSPVVMSETLQLTRAVVVRFARLLLVFGRDGCVICPRVADVLEAGKSMPFCPAVTVINARLERRLFRRRQWLMIQTIQLLVYFP